MKTVAVPALALLLMGSSLSAQDATQAEQPAAADPGTAATTDPAPAAPQGSYSDAQVDSFATAVVKVQEIQADANLAQDQKQEAMVAAVQQAGLDPQTYNSISQAAQSDQQLLERIQVAVAERAGQPTSQ